MNSHHQKVSHLMMLSFNVLPSNTMRMGQAICTIPGLVGVDPVEQFLDEWNRSIWFWIIDHPTKKLGTCLRYPLVTCSRDMFWSDNPVGLALLKKKKGIDLLEPLQKWYGAFQSIVPQTKRCWPRRWHCWWWWHCSFICADKCHQWCLWWRFLPAP